MRYGLPLTVCLQSGENMEKTYEALTAFCFLSAHMHVDSHPLNVCLAKYHSTDLKHPKVANPTILYLPLSC